RLAPTRETVVTTRRHPPARIPPLRAAATRATPTQQGRLAMLTFMRARTLAQLRTTAALPARRGATPRITANVTRGPNASPGRTWLRPALRTRTRSASRVNLARTATPPTPLSASLGTIAVGSKRVGPART